MSDAFSNLMSPLQVGGRTVRNRVLVTGHIPGLEEDGHATDAYVAYHARRARGGAGLQMSGTSGFHRTGHAHNSRGLNFLKPGIEEGLRRLAEAVHGEGGRFLVQLGHSTATIDYGEIGQPLWAPSAVPSQLLKIMPREMTKADIAEVISAYGDAARIVGSTGLDGVEILAAFGFLPGAFMSPLSNRRTDIYGGSVANRVRFALEAAAAVREALGPGRIAGMRIPGDEMMQGGLTGDDMVEVAQLLAASGSLDYLNIAAGNNNDRIMRWEHWPASPAPHGQFVPLAAAIKRVVDIPVFVTGRVTDPAMAEGILARGDADMVGMTRAHIADPDIAAKVAAGRSDEIRPCVGANVCINRAVNGKEVRCFHNPEAGRETSFDNSSKTPAPRRVAVIGGGPAGLEAAYRAARLGHQVELYEASGRLGGQLSLWASSPFAKEYALSVAWYQAELTRRQVRVHLETPVTAEMLAVIEADTVIVATGSRPLDAPLPEGADGCGFDVVTPADVLLDPPATGHAVVVDEGGGRNALAVAEVLAETDVAVTLVTGDAAVAEPVDGTVKTQLYRFLLGKGVQFRPMEEVAGLGAGKVFTRNIYSGESFEIGDVTLLVNWRGNQVVDDLTECARDRFDDVRVVGDGLAPRTVQIAIAEGAEAVRTLSS